jgi:hypothetical protein
MQSDLDLAEHYREEANEFSELARSARPGVFRDAFVVPAYSPLIGLLPRVERSTAILAAAFAAVFMAGTIRVEECRIKPGAFASASRRVCEPSALAFVLARKVDGAIQSIVLR